jgi:phytoene/squalene synthetase
MTAGDAQALSGFTDKWRERWPEWQVAAVFVPASQRERALAWFALRQELLDAAWGGQDPRPGEAKLAWWAEELDGWGRGRRRHPLGETLQRQPVPWSSLAKAAAALATTREAGRDQATAIDALRPLAQATAVVDGALFVPESPASADDALPGLMAEKIRRLGDLAVPLQIRARVGMTGSEHAAARAWAADVLHGWSPSGVGSRATRILSALERRRLQRFVDGAPLLQPVPRWPALWTAWQAARD